MSSPSKNRSTQDDLLVTAVISGDTTTVETLLADGADPSYFDPITNLTPLMHAAIHNRTSIVSLLLSHGAPWNALSPSNLSAGDFSLEHNHQECLQLLLDHAIQSELILGTITRNESKQEVEKNYLEGRVEFSEGRLMDEESKAVMMKWEGPLMEAHAKAVCGNGGRVLNVGFGMGMVDTAIERYHGEVVEHTIVEAHPDVWERMMEEGWGEKEKVKCVFGRWQDVVDQLGSYDGIFFDTYGEYYEDLREFHTHLPKLLKPGGIYSYFNGLCGGNAFFHIVYCHLVALELETLGYSTEFIPLPVKDCLAEEVWEGINHKYWQLDTYNLPICQALSNPE